ncbi:MAG: helix-turn-helix domain-containing protein [Gammaproteobacteria bacterium]|nr:helix-turn-helix domain-containing protein [Gammaproteobacteria bacterium]
MNTNIELLKQAVRHFGGQVATSDRLGVSQALVSKWVRELTELSAEHAMGIERESVGRYQARQLRPDLPWPTVGSVSEAA